jgi:hypothetical protein
MDIERFVLVTETPFEGTTSFLVQRRLRRLGKLIDDPAVVRLPKRHRLATSNAVGLSN